MDLSVVVVSWDTRELTLACLDSVEAERRAQPALEVESIVVDNGSRDGSAEALRARHPQARLVALPENRGFAAGANRGLREARGRLVLLLNSDARLLPGSLAACVEHLDRHPDVGILGPRLLRPDGSTEGSVHAPPGLTGEILPPALRERLLPHRFPPRFPAGEAASTVPAVRGAALFARRSLLESIGPLCEDYFFFFEETDWCLRARRAGHRVVYLPAARVLHVSGASSKRRAPARTRIEYHRSLLRFYERHHGPARRRLLIGLRLAKSLLAVALRAPRAALVPAARSRWRAEWAVVGWYLRGRPDAAGLAGLAAGPAASRAARSADTRASDAAA